MVFGHEKMPAFPSEIPEDAEKRTAGKRGEGFGEMVTESESASKEKVEKTQIFESWQKLITGRESEKRHGAGELKEEEYRNLLYETMVSRLDETINALGINIDHTIINRLHRAENEVQKTAAQKELIASIVHQLSSIPNAKWAFYPREIERQKKINCSGSALLCGYILDKFGIKTEYGTPAGHAVNFAVMVDGSLAYIDSRNNTIKHNLENTEELIEGVRVRRINNKDVGYNIIPVYSQKDSVVAILGNLESLKTSAKKGDLEAREIYENERYLFDQANYQELCDSLYPETSRFLKSKTWQDEEKRAQDLYEKLRKDS